MDKVHGIQTELPSQPEKKKCVEHLYVEADEDHIYKQGEKRTEKKGSMIGKLLYLKEGQEKKDGRKELKKCFYLEVFAAEDRSNRHLFERMQEYIDTNYEPVSGMCGVYQWRWRIMDQSRAEYIERGVLVLG